MKKSSAKKKVLWKVPLMLSISVLIIVTSFLVKDYTDDAYAQNEFDDLAERVQSQQEYATDQSVYGSETSESEGITISENESSGADDIQETNEGTYAFEDEAVEQEDSVLLAKYVELYSENSDLGGWIKIDGTKIDYPVMYTPDDSDKYLHLSFSGEYSSCGVPFIGEGCSINPASQNIIIYGHHMKNGSMFAALVKYRDEEFLEEHKFIYFSTVFEENYYEIYSVFETDAYTAEELGCYTMTEYENEDSFLKFITAIDSIAMYRTEINVTYGDELLILSTCSYHTSEGRFVVVAKKIT